MLYVLRVILLFMLSLGGESIETRSERLYESIPDGIWQSPVHVPVHITRVDLDADNIRTTPNKLYGLMQISVGDEQDELSYCEAYQQQQGTHQVQENELSYCNAYLEHKSFVNTV